MAMYRILSPINYEDRIYLGGESIDLDDSIAEKLPKGVVERVEAQKKEPTKKA